MADHVGVIWQPDVLSLPVYMFCDQLGVFVAVIDDESAFDVDLDRGSEGGDAVQPVVVARDRDVGDHLAIHGGQTAHARRQLVNSRHAVLGARLRIIGIIVYTGIFIKVT